MTTGTALSALLDDYVHNDIRLTAANKLTYLTLGQQRIVRDSPTSIFVKQATISVTVAIGREYSLASDFHMMQAIWLQTQGWKLDPMGDAEFIETVERIPTIPSGPPRMYTILGFDESQGTPAFRIRFDYTPDASYTVTYWYYYMPGTLTGSATPALSAMGFDELLLWATAMIILQQKDPTGYASAVQQYQACLDTFKSYRPMGPDYTPLFRPQSNDYRPRVGWLGPHFPN